MIRFFRRKDSQIRKAYNVIGSKKVLAAVIGQVEEMVSMGLLTPMQHTSEFDWVVIEADLLKREFKSENIEIGLPQFSNLAEAKNYVIRRYEI